MFTKRKTIPLLLFAGLSLGSLQAGAVSYDGTWTLHRHNTGGTTSTPLRTFAGHFCYLSKVGVRETDTSTESGICTVRRRGSDWWLEATLGSSSDNDVFCSATCFNN